MASSADVMFAQLQQDESNRLLEQQRKQQAQLQKRRGRMGLGRFLGMAAGGLLGLATGGGSLLVGALAGLGSRAGSGIAGRTAVDDIEVGKLYQQQAQQARKEGIQAQRDLVRSANVGALSDAFSAYTLAGTNLGQGVRKFAENPVQFTRSMFGNATAPNVTPEQLLKANITPSAQVNRLGINVSDKLSRESFLQTALANQAENLGQQVNPLELLQERITTSLPADYGQMGPNFYGVPGLTSTTIPSGRAISNLSRLSDYTNPFGGM